MKEFGFQKSIIDKMAAMCILTFFRLVSTKSIIDKMAAMCILTFFRLVSTKRGYACSMIVHTRADQLLPQLLMELFDTLYAQC